jgi:integrase
MAEKRICVWVQRFKDRDALMLQWIDPITGKRKSKSAGTTNEKEAQAARIDLESDLNNGRYQQAARLSWEAFREMFETEYVAARRPFTRANYVHMLNLFEGICPINALRSVNERTISAFAAGLRKRKLRGGREGMQPSTIRTHLMMLRSALQWAVRQKLLPAVPAFPTLKVPKKRPQPVPTESFEKLLDKAPDAQTRAYLLAGWLGGLRLREAWELEREPSDAAPWLDFARNRIILPAEFAKAVEDQWVPLDPVLREALEALPHHGRKVFRFVSPSGRPVCAATMSRRVSQLAKMAGVKLTMHSLRKGFGCRYAGKVPAQVLQRLMRHANIKTTMDYYANVDAAVEEAVLGRQRNSLRNTPTLPVEGKQQPNSANPYGETNLQP